MKRGSLLDDLIQLPWWLSIILACVAFVALRSWLPIIELSSPALQGMVHGLSSSAGFIAGLFLATAGLSVFHSWRKGELLNRHAGTKSIQNLSWKDFEFLVSEAYRRKGFAVTENLGGGADGGVDLVLVKKGQKTLVQCKNWKTSKVGVKPVRELYGIVAAEEAAGGILVCSGRFTTAAKQFAKGKRLELVGEAGLIRLIQDVQDTPNIDLNSHVQHCPRCGSDMVLRTAKKGGNAGSLFWGCNRFPKCRGTKEFV